MFLLVVVLCAALVAGDMCCGTCLNGVTNFAVDAMQYPACEAIQYCCFNCGKTPLGAPTILPTAGVTFDGTAIGATTGQPLQIQWASAATVTYVSFAPNQAKTGLALSTSPAATKSGTNTFSICPQFPGTLYFRGFGADICNSVSTEIKVTVTGASGAVCSTPSSPATTPSPGTTQSPTSSGSTSSTLTPGPSSSTASPRDNVTCNAIRGVVVDGQCQCVSDWSGPPDCSGTPLWKTLITIAGGLAAALSIVISIRHFLIMRKTRASARLSTAADDSKHIEMEVMQMSPKRQLSLGDAAFDGHASPSSSPKTKEVSL
ncbi:hypothetical protein SPRG_19336 [Saprolegnia parasitica CBS 223.65]|uniref:EGF-like domain-containing protein n=1 Tax=Saprolegnia parasitica (strain CBS 223.65) TaxID=695850 RepID=A0A067D3Z0_SAPPC|nr:hypothetical protein SPRG_19336 [Saprolegnia parasitica CBS 223.65]KDO33727.1 hypothetical protein SPRG_19336 [Saprolegnia parasitica CBS 223.65]|eukprot:XP_012195747.1 hypothetical protein SPRG_19336 [Saprolegnia parasitica CBS 223.65]